ncbi:glycosyltransferase family 2 protein [Anaerobranca gottschalkii]|uniref:Glycosyl transferase family 2 n=1 Tax=Anaerobranca gottschalkii DSM 13577 TaxID=1120990 RepID=A0A1I0BEB9_9FIRM|nr:glycosyltransferase family 2 protein [Anaerobranca gottschalkii]SET05301.1 Glycosyl transferase family 2 [Anaerobranca gottschalkii DSM 13577]
MLFAIVPAQNEEDRISTALNHLLFVGVDKIVVVANGCIDRTEEIIKNNYPQVHLITFKDSLGIDIPKAIGCAWALKEGATNFLFYDGDLIGEITSELMLLINSHLRNNYCLTLTNCYPTPNLIENLPKELVLPRLHLNELLGVSDKIGISTPSHGPHIISKDLFKYIEVKDIATPPILLAKAVKYGAKIGIGANIPHFRLGSRLKNGSHAKLIFDTIAGDCAEAISIYLGLPKSRCLFGKEYIGYNSKRRFDLLESYLKSLNIQSHI